MNLAGAGRCPIARGLALAALVAACGHAPPRTPPTPPDSAHLLHIDPLADLVPAAGLRWMVDLQPRAILADPALIPAIAVLYSEADLDAQTRAWGGIDPRAASAIVVAGYDSGTLGLARQVLDPGRVEAAFASRVADVEGRAIDQAADDPRAVVVRTWGSLGAHHEALAVFGREAVGLSRGSDAPLRAAELFALERLRRARPAWRAPPLDRLAALLGDAPLRAAAPGPFLGNGLGPGSLLASATSVGVAVRLDAGDPGTLAVTVVIPGSWGDRSREGKSWVARRYALLAASGLGRLLGVDRPAAGPTVQATPEAVTLEVRLRAVPLLRGIRDVTSAQVGAIMEQPDG